jgi:hypothetical protein
MNNIQYLRRKDINEGAWNRCIETASNGLIYGYTYYLDAMCTNWDGMVLNDYEAVMPLPWRRKWGICYLYQPFFTPALGIFGHGLTKLQQILFIRAIPKKFLYWDIDLNETSEFDQAVTSISNIEISLRTNFLLNLNSSYQIIYKSYSRLAKRKLAKANQYRLKLEIGVPAEEIITLYRKHYSLANKEVPEEAYILLSSLTSHLSANHIVTYLAKTESGSIAGFYLLLTDTKWVYSVLGGSTADGKEMGAFYFLTDAAIKDQTCIGKIFRFEGSDIPGIAFFDQQFGPQATNYLHIRRNNLPWPVNLLKQ